MSNTPAQLRYDLNALNVLLFNVIKQDAEGSDVRTALGAGAAARIVFAFELDLLEPQQWPARPFLAFRDGPVPSVDRVIAEAIHRWWIYDELNEGYWRINSLIPLLSRAYAAAKPRLQLAGNGVIGNVTVRDPSGSTRDPAFDLRTRYVTVATLLS